MKIEFNIKFRPQIESGEYKVILDCGVEAEILAWDKSGEYPIVCMARKDGAIPFRVNNKGKAYHFPEGANYSDLFIVTTEPELSEFEERIFKLLRQYKECDIPLTPENIKAEASMLWPDFEKYFFDLYGKEGEGDSSLRSFYYRGLKDGKAEALKDLQENLANNDVYSVPEWLREVLLMAKENGKKEALKDLPRWKKQQYASNGANIYWPTNELTYRGMVIRIDELTKLPGFKEDESHE